MNPFADGLNNSSSTFIVKNNSKKSIAVMGIRIPPGGSYNLMNLPGITEADIKVALTKGVIKRKINTRELQVLSSDLSLDTTNYSQRSFLLNNNIVNEPSNTTDLLSFSSPVLLFDPERSSLVNGGAGLVTNVRDASPSANHATASGVNRPSITNINGRSVINLTGAPTSLSLTSEITNAQAIFMVYQYKSGAANSYAPLLGSNATYYDLNGNVDGSLLLEPSNSALQVRPQINGAGGQYGGTWRINGRFIQSPQTTAKPTSLSVITIIPGLPGTPQDTPIRFDNIANDRNSGQRYDRSLRGRMVVYSKRPSYEDILSIEKNLLDFYSIDKGTLPKVLLASGNSIMAGSSLSAGLDPLSQATLYLNNSSAWDIWNVSQSAQRTWQMRFGDGLLSYFGDPINLDSRCDPARADQVIFGYEIGNEMLDGVSKEQAYLNYVYWCQERFAATGAKIVATTIFSRTDIAWSKISYVNEQIRANWQSFAYALCDLEKDCTGMSGSTGYTNTTYFMVDGIHPNATGSNLMGRVMASLINQISP